MGALLDVDVTVRDWCDGHRPEPLRLAARTLYFLGSANVIAPLLLVLAALLAVRGSALWLVLRRLAGGTATRPQRLYLPSSA